MTVRRALISVFDKTGVVDFARGLTELGVEIISTGGTARVLKESGLPVTPVSEVTGFPEILGGRVKTLHPKVHGGILALRSEDHMRQLAENGIAPIDLVAVNLYPFRETVARPGVTLEEAVENIDIGGPAMVRAAAKNYRHVVVAVNPGRYGAILAALKEKGEVDKGLRLQLAREAFAHTAAYDAAIFDYLQSLECKWVQELECGPGQRLEGTQGQERELGCEQGQGLQGSQGDAAAEFPRELTVSFELAQTLRYGENPHQKAAFYKDSRLSGACVGNAIQLHGKELSYNNILDLNAALELVREFTEPAAVIIKHNNPCGAACAGDLCTAYERAFAGDPVSAFGGIVAFNRELDKDTAGEMVQTFLEAVIAPGYEEDALEILKKKEGLRVLKTDKLDRCPSDRLEMRKVRGGILVQEWDEEVLREDALKVVTKREPSREEMEELVFAMKIVKHVKSNAIVVTKDKQLIGVGAGQMNRVGAAKIALEQAGERSKGAVLASDAFFPFRDTLDEAAAAGISAVIQPGGSVKDKESIQAADEHGIAMVFTGMRHFKH